MKIQAILAILFVLSVATCTQSLRKHELPFMDSMNPIQMAQVMSGDYVSILPASIQPLARKILGQEKQSGVSGFLSQAQSMMGGSSNSASGGILGGMSNLFSSAASSGQSNGVLSGFASALGVNGGSGAGGMLNSFTNAFGSAGQTAANAFGSAGQAAANGASSMMSNFGFHK